MLVKILIVLGIALVMGLVLWALIRRSADSGEQPGPVSRRGGPLPQPGAPSVRSAAQDVAAQMNWLVGMGGDVLGKTFHVANRTGTIGRGLGNFIQTTDPDASRVHCQFMPVPSGLQLKDMDSSNGTFVNNQRIAVSLLKDGDQVRIGKAVFLYRSRGDFHVDFGVQQRKVAGAAAARQTQLGVSGDLRTMLRQYLDNAGGDIPRAAGAMGVKPEAFVKMLSDYGLGQDEPRGPAGQ